ncbi:MAG: hypothetical protein AM326_02265 [Candidatus Thorarchaeota archaeon SMTZ-45]|nr:MAG: hypothetical protein AM326_02265 [Candidatus Thorarchaeota archaeon SMTZ-45]
MSQGLELLTGKIRRRRRRYQIFAVITIVALVLAGITGFLIYGATEPGFSSVQSSLFLTFAILLLFLIPTRDMRRAEAIINLAAEHGGTLDVETVRKKLGLPDEKAEALLDWMIKQKMAEKREQTDRWVFPELRKGRDRK